MDFLSVTSLLGVEGMGGCSRFRHAQVLVVNDNRSAQTILVTARNGELAFSHL